jgi:hypothetical protein
MYTDYLVLGLVAIFGVMAIFIGSMVIRHFNLRRTLQQLETLDEERD